MRVIFITDSYYPKPSPNAICVEKIKSEFENRGIDTYVIALRTFPRNVVLHSDDSVYFIKPDMFYSSWYEANDKHRIWKIKLLQKLFRLRGALYGFSWPLMSHTHLSRYEKQLNSLLCKLGDKDTVVIGVYKSLEAAFAGVKIKKQFCSAKYILYSLDAVAGSIIPTIYGSKLIAQNSIRRWEKKLFDAYDFLYLMKSHIHTYSGERYSKYIDKVRFVDIPLLDINTDKLEKIPSLIKHLVFTGSMSTVTADPRYLLKLTELINDENIVIDFYGSVSDPEIISAIEKSPRAIYHGKLSHEEIVRVQNASFALLNFGNYTPCGIPCKIFEYFSTGKPIISCFKIDEDASKPYMQKYPGSLLIDERKSIKDNASALSAFLSSDYSVDKSCISELYYDNTPKATVDIIISDCMR